MLLIKKIINALFYGKLDISVVSHKRDNIAVVLIELTVTTISVRLHLGQAEHIHDNRYK